VEVGAGFMPLAAKPGGVPIEKSQASVGSFGTSQA